MEPKRILIIGFFLVLTGFVLPLLMVIKVIEPTFLLSFLSYGSSLTGLILGFIGAARYTQTMRKE
jgi:hypothetical protein